MMSPAAAGDLLIAKRPGGTEVPAIASPQSTQGGAQLLRSDACGYGGTRAMRPGPEAAGDPPQEAPMPTPTTIMLIRHAEKPYGKHFGVDEHGNQNPESLIVRGWQRAGAITALFDPAAGPLQSIYLVVPTVIYASNPVTSSVASKKAAKKIGSKSRRPLETITPLATRLGLTPNLSFVEGQEKELAADVLTQSGVVLVAWQHEEIPTIAKHIVGANPPLPPYPKKWPSNRFDVVWVFWPPTPPSTPWNFAQVPQQLLAGDTDTVIPPIIPSAAA
jgi:hypothetical protein